MHISAIDVSIVGMNRHELSGLGIAMDGGADLQPWEAVRQMPAFHTALLTGTTSIITFRQQDRVNGRLGNLCRHFGTKIV